MLEISQLTVTVRMHGRRARIVTGASLHAAPGEVVGLIGESGAGKSTLARAVLGLLPEGGEVNGQVRWDGRDVLSMTRRELREFRSRSVAMITQDPRASVNPLHSVGVFVTEALRACRGMSKPEARQRAAAALRSVGLDGAATLRQYPYQLSGGMLQRVVIAAALAAEPRLLVADEPTSALDVTTQAEIMAILRSLHRERAGSKRAAGSSHKTLTTLLVTHNLELAAIMCDRVYVMRKGEIVEEGPATEVLDTPQHPYTAELREATLALSGLPAPGTAP